jgi:hypothetical protein
MRNRELTAEEQAQIDDEKAYKAELATHRRRLKYFRTKMVKVAKDDGIRMLEFHLIHYKSHTVNTQRKHSISQDDAIDIVEEVIKEHYDNLRALQGIDKTQTRIS